MATPATVRLRKVILDAKDRCLRTGSAASGTSAQWRASGNSTVACTPPAGLRP